MSEPSIRKPPPAIMRPTLGRIVHYVEDGQVFPALVVKVAPPGMSINLVLWNEFGTSQGRHDVRYSDNPARENKTWFWPAIPRLTLEEVKALALASETPAHKLAPPAQRK
jgi:hypothetical protein